MGVNLHNLPFYVILFIRHCMNYRPAPKNNNALKNACVHNDIKQTVL